MALILPGVCKKSPTTENLDDGITSVDATGVQLDCSGPDSLDLQLDASISDGVLCLNFSTTPSAAGVDDMMVAYEPATENFPHPIFNETAGFAYHEYAESTLDTMRCR